MKACEEPGAEMLLGRCVETDTGSFPYAGFKLPPRGSSPAPLLLSRRCPRCLALEGAKAFLAPFLPGHVLTYYGGGPSLLLNFTVGLIL